MVTDYRIENEEIRWINEEELMKYLRQIKLVTNTIILQRTQTAADAAAEIQEAGGLTITHLSAKADLEVWSETDHADAQGLAVTGEYVDENGLIVEISGTLNAVDSTASEKIITAEFLDLRSAIIATAQDGDAGYIAFGNNAKNAWYGMIEQGNLYSIHSRHRTITNRRTFLSEIELTKNGETAVTSIHVTYTPKATEEEVIRNFHTIRAYELFNKTPIELLENTIVSFTIEDDNAAHPVCDINIKIIEAYTGGN